MRLIARALAGVSAATLLVAAAACQGAPDDDSDETPSPPPATATMPADPATEASPTGAAPGDLTPPGTELSVGETAVVPLRGGTMAITVTAIEEGDQSLFQEQVENAEDWEVYYVWVTAENMSAEDMYAVGLPTLSAVLPDGEATRFRMIGGRDLGDCEHVAFPVDSLQGATIETCSLTAVEEGTEPAGALWDDRDAGYDDEPIIWWAD